MYVKITYCTLEDRFRPRKESAYLEVSYRKPYNLHSFCDYVFSYFLLTHLI